MERGGEGLPPTEGTARGGKVLVVADLQHVVDHLYDRLPGPRGGQPELGLEAQHLLHRERGVHHIILGHKPDLPPQRGAEDDN